MASYKIGEVAELLGISVDSVRRLTDSGRLPRQDGRWPTRRRREELARFMAKPPADVKPETTVGRWPATISRGRHGASGQEPGHGNSVELQAGPYRLVS